MDSLGPAVSKLQGKTERRLPPCPTAGHSSSFRSRSLAAASARPRCSRSILQRATYSLPPSTAPTGKGLHGPEHPTSIRHFGPCYDTPLAWLPYCEILAAFFPRPFTSSPSSFPAPLFLLHSTFLIVSIFSPLSFFPLYPHHSSLSFPLSLSLSVSRSFLSASSLPFAPFSPCSRRLNLPILRLPPLILFSSRFSFLLPPRGERARPSFVSFLSASPEFYYPYRPTRAARGSHRRSRVHGNRESVARFSR